MPVRPVNITGSFRRAQQSTTHLQLILKRFKERRTKFLMMSAKSLFLKHRLEMKKLLIWKESERVRRRYPCVTCPRGELQARDNPSKRSVPNLTQPVLEAIGDNVDDAVKVSINKIVCSSANGHQPVVLNRLGDVAFRLRKL